MKPLKWTGGENTTAYVVLDRIKSTYYFYKEMNLIIVKLPVLNRPTVAEEINQNVQTSDIENEQVKNLNLCILVD